MDNQEILDQVNSALKTITTSDLKSSKLTPEKQDEFVRTVAKSTRMLDAARKIDMSSHTYDIDRVGFGDRILRKANENEDPDHDSDPNFHTNQLESKEVIAVAGITDSTMEDNIEKDDFEDTLLDLIGDRAGVDMEELFVAGDKDDSDSFLALTDGWLEKAANSIGSDDFDSEDVEDMFDNMVKAVPKKYFRDRSEWTLWVHWDIEDSYRDKVRDRGTGLGDTAQTEGGELAYKGFKVQYSASLPEGTALLAPDDNLVYGIYRDVTIEPDRNAKKRRTDFVCTMRIDCHYEDENAACVATGWDG